MNREPSNSSRDWRIRRLALGVDLEEFQPRPGRPAGGTALPVLVEALLQVLARRGVKATFFTVGETARRYQDLVAAIAADGHEIASHGYRHLPLAKQDPRTFADDLQESLDVLHALSPRPVIGYRAPLLSMTPHTAWAYAALHDAGIRYSSSVFPAANVQHGWPGCPSHPHVRDGVLEYPITPTRIAGALVPAVGGAYFRIFPRRLLFRALRSLGGTPLITSYFHPYDYDVHQPFALHRELARKPWLAPLLFYNRGDFLPRLEVLLDHADSVIPFSRHAAATHEKPV
jgi:polysaccharide deacetylase family protein (PEP-CTERM system associated)